MMHANSVKQFENNTSFIPFSFLTSGIGALGIGVELTTASNINACNVQNDSLIIILIFYSWKHNYLRCIYIMSTI